VVAAYAGGIPSLAKDEESCLFFPPGDETLCASQLARLLSEQDLASRLSRESRKIAAIRNDRPRIVGRQLEIYRQILDGAERG
jgi:L-malate glycosyltransferase